MKKAFDKVRIELDQATQVTEQQKLDQDQDKQIKTLETMVKAIKEKIYSDALPPPINQPPSAVNQAQNVTVGK